MDMYVNDVRLGERRSRKTPSAMITATVSCLAKYENNNLLLGVVPAVIGGVTTSMSNLGITTRWDETLRGDVLLPLLVLKRRKGR